MGWLDKLQDGAKFDGLTNKGFNKNGSWGGQFQSGGTADRKAYNEMVRYVEPKARLTRADLYPESEGTRLAAIQAANEKRKAIQISGMTALKEENSRVMRAKGIDPDDPEAVKAFWRADEKEKRKSSVPQMGGLGTGSAMTKTNFVYGCAPKQNGGNMNYYKSGLDFEPKSISQSGSVIEDDLGQWAHPGEITRINSNNITMRGVDFPVLGVSDKGDKKLMKPGKDYKFKGKSVTEYPIAQDGKELKQLLNFTNKPDKRWLDNL